MQRKKYKDIFIESYSSIKEQYICIHGERWIWKREFLRELEEEFFWSQETEWLIINEENPLEDATIENIHTKILVLFSDSTLDFSSIRTFIESQLYVWKIIYTSEIKNETSDVYNFNLPGVSFREYAEYMWYSINIGDIAAGNSNISMLNTLKEDYLFLWHKPSHIESPDTILTDFHVTMNTIHSDLFPKEYDIFLEYTRSMAMNMGNLFKADQLAKLLWISRRKINKYTEILMKHGIVKAIGPWWENTETETSRHVKIYFTDLSFIRAALGDLYYQWQMKQGIIENFIFLELERKLDSSHRISFYRKKSGAEITFILENITNEKLTPIELSIRSTSAISQAIRTFDDSYNTRVEYFMLINESHYEKRLLNWKPFIILPQIWI